MRKGQSEAIGLVIIVILITLAIFFVISFTMKEDIKPKEYSDYELMAESTIVALLQATPNCSFSNQPAQIKDFLIEVAKGNDDYQKDSCGKNNYYNAKTFINQTISDLLNETLGIRKKKYLFVSKIIGEEPIINISNNFHLCQGDIFSSHPYPYPVMNKGILENQLSICG